MLAPRRVLPLLGLLAAAVACAYWALQKGSGTPVAATKAAGIEKVSGRALRDLGETKGPRRVAVRGTVRSTARAPVRAANLCLLRDTRDEPKTPAAWDLVGCVLSNQRGAFAFALESGVHAKYLVTASAAEYQPAAREIGEEELRGSSSMLSVDLVLQKGGARVGGTVVDATGGPVPGAQVLVKAEGSLSPIATTTRALGDFTVFFVPGPIVVAAEAEGYSRAQTNGVAPDDHLKLTLAPGATIVGRVIEWGSGRAVPGVAVTATRTRGFELLDRGSAVSNEAGKFTIARLVPGTYQVTAKAEHWSGSSKEIGVGPLETSPVVVLRVAPAASLQCEVRVEHEPCADGSVRMVGPQDGAVKQTDLAGLVRFQGVRPGTYSVVASCGGAVSKVDSVKLVAGDNPPRFWDLGKGLSIRGRVVGTDQSPRSGVSIAVTRSASRWGLSRRCIRSDGGHFECSGLEPGAYECAAVDDAGVALSDPVTIALGNGSVDSVLLPLHEMGSIRVLVRSAADEPRNNALIFARSEGSILRPVPRRTQGEYVLENVALGTYQVVEGTPPAEQQGKTVHLTSAGQVATVELVARERAAVTGRVVDEQGDPVMDAWVRVAMPVFGSHDLSPVLTDAEGWFEFADLSDGSSYRLEVESVSAAGALDNVLAGSQVTVQVQTYASLSGHVLDANGKPVPEFTLSFQDEQGGGSRVFSDPDGEWRLVSLRPGRLTLRATCGSGEGTRTVDLVGGIDQQLDLKISNMPSTSAPDAAPAFVVPLPPPPGAPG